MRISHNSDWGHLKLRLQKNRFQAGVMFIFRINIDRICSSYMEVNFQISEYSIKLSDHLILPAWRQVVVLQNYDCTCVHNLLFSFAKYSLYASKYTYNYAWLHGYLCGRLKNKKCTRNVMEVKKYKCRLHKNVIVVFTYLIICVF